MTASIRRARGQKPGAIHGGERDRRLDRRQSDEIGIERRALGACDRFAQRIAVHQPGESEQRDGDVEARRRLRGTAPAKQRSPTPRRRIRAVDRRLADMRGDSDHHGDHIAGDEPLASPLRRRQAPDGNDGGQVIKPDDRMAEPGEQARP